MMIIYSILELAFKKDTYFEHYLAHAALTLPTSWTAFTKVEKEENYEDEIFKTFKIFFQYKCFTAHTYHRLAIKIVMIREIFQDSFVV